MAGSVNKAILIGNLGKDPEIRTLESGVSVATIVIATSERYKDRTTGELKESTDWHNIVLWRGLADIAQKYLRKGNQVYIEGKIKTRSYTDKEGNTRYITEIVADNLTMLGSRSSENSGSAQNTGQTAPAQQQPAANDNTAASAFDDTGTEDDLPF